MVWALIRKLRNDILSALSLCKLLLRQSWFTWLCSTQWYARFNVSGSCHTRLYKLWQNCDMKIRPNKAYFCLLFQSLRPKNVSFSGVATQSDLPWVYKVSWEGLELASEFIFAEKLQAQLWAVIPKLRHVNNEDGDSIFAVDTKPMINGRNKLPLDKTTVYFERS